MDHPERMAREAESRICSDPMGRFFQGLTNSSAKQTGREIIATKAPGGFSTWKTLDRSKVVLDLL